MEPLPLISTPSYNCCAIRIVLDVAKFNLEEASCCNVLVVNGSGAFLWRSLSLIDAILKDCFPIVSMIWSSSALEDISSLSLPFPMYLNSMLFLAFSGASIAESVQYSFGINSLISFSLSQISFNATDCTRPALKPLLIFAQRSGLIL